ncbi:lipoyl synthase [Ectothiorhodospiraceae bacterium BW-2]|nr:lipoyl synthase [Ectothiorhodospiraceae bacterium BW-2]
MRGSLLSEAEFERPPFDHSAQVNVSRMPAWIRQPLGAALYSVTAKTLHRQQLHTVCESARCPNRGECWSEGSATFMLLGDICTRACGFCAVKTGRPLAVDRDEPQRVAAAVKQMGLSYVVLTSVNRDELADGGAAIFAATMAALYALNPAIGQELLTPDFRHCQAEAVALLRSVLPAGKRWVWGHNIETVPSLYATVRKGSRYQRSLELLQQAAALDGVAAKSALMLGLGESDSEVEQVLRDLYEVGVERIAMGQYLRPGRCHLPVKRYVTPVEFQSYGQMAREIGFPWVQSAPMVRSSYHADLSTLPLTE